MTLLPTITYVHAAATVMMTGLIWFVKIVHYPLMARIDANHFVAYERQHVRRTGWIVGPLMLAEAVTAVALLFTLSRNPNLTLAWIGVALLVVIWLSTGLLQAPCHRRLERSFSIDAVRRLVQSNWLRTVLWSARAMIALYLLASEAAG